MPGSEPRRHLQERHDFWPAVRRAVLVIVLLATQAAGWNQLHGDAARSGQITPPGGLLDGVFLDVLEEIEFLTAPDTFAARLGPRLVAHDDGFLGVLRGQLGDCRLFTYPPGMPPVVLSPPACTNGWFQGIDEQGQQILMCQETQRERRPVLVAYGIDGSFKWGIHPLRDFVLPEGLSSPTGDPFSWACDGVAIDERQRWAYVPFWATSAGPDAPRHRIAKIALDTGKVEWATTVPAWTLVSATEAPVNHTRGEFTNVDFAPRSVSVTDGTKGIIVVSGVATCPDSVPCGQEVRPAAAVAWLDMDGAVLGMEIAANNPTATGAPDQVSVHPAGREKAAVLLGDDVIWIEPGEPLRRDTAGLSGADSKQRWPGAAWLGNSTRAAIATDVSLNVFEFSEGSAEAVWPQAFAPPHLPVVELATSSNTRVLVLTAAAEAQPPQAELFILESSTGSVTQRLPLHVRTTSSLTGISGTDPGSGDWLLPPQFVPTSDGFMVVDHEGRGVRLGVSDVKPTLRLGNAYPPISEDTQLFLDWPAGRNITSLWVSWGDAQTPNAEATKELTHTFSAVGDYRIVVTAIGADGRTMTASTTVHVGASPPASQNFLAAWFLGDTADTAWGIVGIGVAAIGGAVALRRRQRHRSTRSNDMAELEAIRAEGANDPAAALVRLQVLRGRVRAELADQRLDEAQAGLVMDGAAKVAKTLLYQAVAPIRDRLDALYQGMLVGFFEDGQITEVEVNLALRGLAGQKGIKKAERQEFEVLLRSLADV